MRASAFLLFLLILVSIQVASAGIFLSGEDAKFETGLYAVSIPTTPVSLKTIFVSNADTIFKTNLNRVSIPTTPEPPKEIFISGVDAVLVMDLIPMNKPTVSISTDKSEYTAGDTMLIKITITNPTEEWQNVLFVWRLDLPEYEKSFPIVNKSLKLPPNFNKTFTFKWKLPTWKLTFKAAWYVALYNTSTYELHCEDKADWKYISATKEAPPEEIARDLENITVSRDVL